MKRTRTVLVVVLTVALGGPAAAQVCLEEVGPPVRMDQVGQGTLLFKTAAPGLFVEAPTVDTDVVIDVVGMIARATVRQRFTNPSDEWVEGVYVFPLPDDAAVDHMRLVVGQRIIEGQIREREEARRTYESAKREGRKASLLEQERPNIFTASVANVGPRESVDVALEYQQTLRYDSGSFALRFPMVVGPRFIPGTPVAGAAAGGAAPIVPAGLGWALDTDAVPDASHITPPVAPPTQGKVNPVSITVELDAGFPLARVVSPFHPVAITYRGTGRATVTLDEGTVWADRDFALEWSPEVGAEPQAALLSEELEGEGYALVMVLPPATTAGARRLPREVVFVIDTSGSMNGASILQARAALTLALARLDMDDTFNVIEFNNSARALFPETQPATPAYVGEALDFVSGLQADGGTNMRPALEVALGDQERAGARVRQVVFITDGCVGNESQLLSLIAERLGATRLFTVGIGSAPNGFFMRKAAEMGRGDFTTIGSPSEVESRMGELFRKLESPVLTDLQLQWDDPNAESYPARLGDLYVGEPAVIVTRVPALWGGLRLVGRRGEEEWDRSVALTGGERRGGIARLWARRKIEALTDAAAAGQSRQGVREQIVEIGLRFHLVSKYTSLVAVDVTPTAPAEASVTRAVPTNLPAGWTLARVAGGAPQTALGWRLHLLVGLALVILGVAGLKLRRLP
jgi:Ca-activated chloride channel family protein